MQKTVAKADACLARSGRPRSLAPSLPTHLRGLRRGRKASAQAQCTHASHERNFGTCRAQTCGSASEGGRRGGASPLTAECGAPKGHDSGASGAQELAGRVACILAGDGARVATPPRAGCTGEQHLPKWRRWRPRRTAPPPPRAGARAARRTPTSPSGRCYAGEATRYPPQTRPTESRRARAQALPAGALPKKGARHPREGTGAGHLRIEAGCHYGARAGPVRNGVLRDWTETTALPRAPSCFADALLPQCNVQARSSHRHTHTHTMMTMFPLEPRCLRIRRVRYCSKYAR